jgi:prophage maintenance system killer protein
VAGKLFNLTVQDVLWLHREIARRNVSFRYADLEEATFYQFGYGSSLDLFGQAGRFLSGFLKKRPFAEGNEAAAVAAALSFLEINGHDTSSADVLALLAAGGEGTEAAVAALRDSAREHGHDDHHGHEEIKPDIRAAIRRVLARHERALAELGATPAESAVS